MSDDYESGVPKPKGVYSLCCSSGFSARYQQVG